MSGNSSATGGFLEQITPPFSDDDRMNALHDVVVGVLGLTPSLVRPRWQPNEPKQPDATTDWVALGITEVDGTDFPHFQHVNGGPSILTRWQQFAVMVSCYGPNAQRNITELRDSLYVPQNLESLNRFAIKLHGTQPTTTVPELVNNQWINRVDMTVSFVQEVTRDYNILDIASSQGTITANDGVTAQYDTSTTQE